MGDKTKLLMIDDDEDLLRLVKMKLEKTGQFDVTYSTKGSQAVNLARDLSPDLVILDIDMPEMSGGEVADALSEADDTKDLPVLFLSSMIANGETSSQIQMIGGRRMISKSVKIKDLIAAIETILG